jgi:rhamnogalacturonan endolyase
MRLIIRRLCTILLTATCLFQWTAAQGAFGVTSSGGYYTVDTGAGLVFKVNQSNGDITSLKINGTEYQATDKNTHIASGLGTPTTVTATTYGNNYIKIAITTDPTNAVVNSLTQYLMVKNGYNNIYLATYVTTEPAVGELRWSTRLQSAYFTNSPVPSDLRGNTGAIESTDVYGMADGTTRSKYYGRHRAMELTYNGASGANIGVWMVFDNRESSAGGPFYRDIENQCGTDEEVYNYMNSGHEQTEAWRMNVLCGPYALVFTTGAPPALPLDFSWIETGGLDLTGWVSATNRGALAGVASGIPAGFQGVVGFANTNAQYWAVISSNGTYTTPLMKPGTYAVTLFKGELPVGSSTVTVSTGTTNTLNLASTETLPNFIFKIGEWDGTPAGFLNASNIVNMHPQDIRCAGASGTNWGPMTFTVGVNSDRDFPSIQLRATNSPTTILFNLTAGQIATLSLRIGMTCAYNNGRPQVVINSHSLSYPGASSQPNSRSFTTGTWRGNETNETYSISSSYLLAGQNTLTITPVSGNADLGPWLSAGWVFDAAELMVPNTSPAIPATPTNLTATALNGSQIRLTWKDNATNEINYLVERSADNLTFNLIAALAAGTTNFTDTRLASGTTNFYRARAANAGGNSGYSNVASARTIPFQFGGVNALGTNLVVSGTGGTPGSSYTILASTNLLLPVAQWSTAGTGSFDTNGNFTASNSVTTGSPRRFYLIRLP